MGWDFEDTEVWFFGELEIAKKSIQKGVVPRGGIEPPTQGFSVLCSTN